jgi:hypothetical protein
MSENSQNTEQKAEPAPLFHVVVVGDFGVPQMLVFNSITEAAQCIKGYKQTGECVYAYVVEGQQWRTTVGEKNYLVSPRHDSRVPLFDDDEQPLSEDGRI